MTSTNYSRLSLSDESEDSTELLNGKKSIAWSARNASTNQSILLPIALLLLILLDAGVYFYITKTLSDLSTPINIETLPFRDPYIGLDELYRLKKIKPAEYMPIINKPLVSSPVDSKKPNAAAVDDEHRYYTDFGMLSPVDRRLYVTEEIHTIAQYRVLDFGMESCRLTLALPVSDSTPPLGTPVHLDVCLLDANRVYKPSEITWNSKPSCVKDIGPIDGIWGKEVMLDAFDCKWAELYSYEISCKGNGCGVDVWAPMNETQGLFIRQFQTLV